jgi:hypothetical protein
VIIASDLLTAQEEKLLVVLKEHKEAIGWNIEDIKGISHSVVMHKIHDMVVSYTKISIIKLPLAMVRILVG